MVVNFFESVSHNALVSYQYSYQTLLSDGLHGGKVHFARRTVWRFARVQRARKRHAGTSQHWWLVHSVGAPRFFVGFVTKLRNPDPLPTHFEITLAKLRVAGELSTVRRWSAWDEPMLAPGERDDDPSAPHHGMKTAVAHPVPAIAKLNEQYDTSEHRAGWRAELAGSGGSPYRARDLAMGPIK
jgi:hypothetical protein